MREPQIGDRYRWQDGFQIDIVWEILEIGELYRIKIINSNNIYNAGSIHTGWYPNSNDTYIGNFTKSENFSSLYSILSELSDKH